MYARQAKVRRKEKLERLALIKERHRKLILEPREAAHVDALSDLDLTEFDFDLELDLN